MPECGGDVVVVEAANPKILVVQWAHQHFAERDKTRVQTEGIVSMPSIQKVNIQGTLAGLVIEKQGGQGLGNGGRKRHIDRFLSRGVQLRGRFARMFRVCFTAQ